MSVSDRTIDPKLLASAGKEFLTKGFMNASIVEICRNAGVTTGALYKRFMNKEDLFGHLVKDVIADLTQINDMKEKLLDGDVTDELLVCCWDMNESVMQAWFDFLEERRDAFTMLMRCAEGTRFEKFEDDYSRRMTDLNYKFYRICYERGIATARISKRDLHVADSAYWKAISEPFIHDYTYKEMKTLNHHICHFFDYKRMLGIKDEFIERYKDSSLGPIIKGLRKNNE